MPKKSRSKSRFTRTKPKNKSLFRKIRLFLGIGAIIIVGSIFSSVIAPKHTATGDPLCANSYSCIKDLSGKYDPNFKSGVFMGSAVSIPKQLAQKDNVQPVLGEATASNKHIYIDLTNQRIYAFEGNTLIHNFLVSTGKWGRTPTGDFNIWIKLRYTRMSGGNQALGTYYNLPNVPYTMYFYNKDVPKTMGYGIHGAYWHNNFGHPMSHGCINMKEEEVAQLYAWAQPTNVGNTTYASEDDPGTPITIYGTAPAE